MLNSDYIKYITNFEQLSNEELQHLNILTSGQLLFIDNKSQCVDLVLDEIVEQVKLKVDKMYIKMLFNQIADFNGLYNTIILKHPECTSDGYNPNVKW